MIIKQLSFIVLSFIAINTFGQSDIDFFPKALVKELSKQSEIGKADLEELKVSDCNGVSGKYFKFVNQKDTPFAYLYVGRVNSCRAGGCSNENNLFTLERSEYFDYFILFGKSGSVNIVKVYNYQATHGQEVTSPAWLRQFKDYNGSANLNVGKNIDAISGATISVYGITADIEHKTKLLKQIAF
jgi:hypothetical protein